MSQRERAVLTVQNIGLALVCTALVAVIMHPVLIMTS